MHTKHTEKKYLCVGETGARLVQDTAWSRCRQAQARHRHRAVAQAEKATVSGSCTQEFVFRVLYRGTTRKTKFSGKSRVAYT